MIVPRPTVVTVRRNGKVTKLYAGWKAKPSTTDEESGWRRVGQD